MIKRIIVVVALLLASALFAFIGMWIAPFGVGLFRSNDTYNIILAIVLAVITIITIILLCKKCLRIYSLLFIPHIIALGIVMLHVGNNIYYMGSGFISVGFKPYKSIPQIRTTSGRVIFKDAYDIHLNDSYDKVFFYKGSFTNRLYRIYDVNGYCVLVKPEDDKQMGCFNEGFWSMNESKRDNDQIYRVRFFDLLGNYIFTRFYKRNPCFTIIESLDDKEFIRETTEIVTELSDGLKKFSKGTGDLSTTSQERKYDSPTIVEESRPSGHYVDIECKACHGYGRHIMIECYRCEGYGWLEPGFGPRGNGTMNDRTICDVCNGNKKRQCPAAGVNLRVYVKDK